MRIKKNEILIILIISVCIFIGILTSKCYATDGLKIESIDVTAPSAGVYGVGQEITIKVSFNQGIKGVMPKYRVYFGNNSLDVREIETSEITNYTTEVLYKYTIKSGDNGELKPDGFSTASSAVESEDGESYYIPSTMMLHFPNVILADTTISWTDFSNAKIDFASDVTNSNLDQYIKFEDCNLNSKNNNYYIHYEHSDIDTTVNNFKDISENLGQDKFWQSTTLSQNNMKISESGYLSDFLANAGDIYITICEVDSETYIPKIVLESRKIERLEKLPLTKRLSVFFLNSSTGTFCWEPYGNKNERKINYKIGKVTDNTLLNALKEGNDSAINDLLVYAKNGIEIKSGSINLGDSDSITNSFNIEDGAYYFGYFELDNQNGKYYDVEDVMLYQGYSNTDLKFLSQMYDKDFKWNLDNSKPNTPDDTVIKTSVLPRTGRSICLTIVFMFAMISGIVLYNKNKKYKCIK